jgi:hypothetical protein
LVSSVMRAQVAEQVSSTKRSEAVFDMELNVSRQIGRY